MEVISNPSSEPTYDLLKTCVLGRRPLVWVRKPSLVRPINWICLSPHFSHFQMELMALYMDSVQGEIEELDLLLDLLDSRSATLNWVEIRKVLVVRHSLAIAIHESLLENCPGSTTSSRVRQRRRSMTPDRQVPSRL